MGIYNRDAENVNRKTIEKKDNFMLTILTRVIQSPHQHQKRMGIMANTKNIGGTIKQSTADYLEEMAALTGIKKQRLIEDALDMYLPEVEKLHRDSQKKGKR